MYHKHMVCVWTVSKARLRYNSFIIFQTASSIEDMWDEKLQGYLTYETF